MTPRLARNQRIVPTANKKGLAIFKRKSVGVNKYLKKLLGGGRVLQQSIEAAPSSSWICTSPSWTNVKIVDITNSEIYGSPFASWSIFDEDIGNDDFLGECMRLFRMWQWFLEEIEEDSSEEEEEEEEGWHGKWNEDFVDECCLCCQREEEDMDIDEDDEEEIDVEPESHDSLLMAALLSTKELLPVPSNGVIRALSCPDLLMTSLSVLLSETRHLNYINERLSLPPPPKWMTAMESIREMDPPNSLVSTVSLPSGWDAVSARLSTSSIFNLFSDLAASPIPSLFSIDPTGAPSTGSTVSVPLSFWDTPSTVSVTGSVPPVDSSVPIPSTSVLPGRVLYVSMWNENSDYSSEPTTTCSSCLSRKNSSSPLFFCGICNVFHSKKCEKETTDSTSSDSSASTASVIESSEDSFNPYLEEVPRFTSSSSDSENTTESSSTGTSTRLRRVGGVTYRKTRPRVSFASETSVHSYDVASYSSSGYETDVDSEPVLKKATSSASSQTEAIDKDAVARMLAECDSMLEKIETMKKRLREMK